MHSDGGCASIKGKGRVSSIGVFWGNESPFNLSAICGHPPFTNQRAELEAILAAVTSASARGITTLILCSDSSYAVKGLTEYSPEWKKQYFEGEELYHYYNRNGQELANGDLFAQIAANMIIQYEHVPRAQNKEADALASAAMTKEIAAQISVVRTRSQYPVEVEEDTNDHQVPKL